MYNTKEKKLEKFKTNDYQRDGSPKMVQTNLILIANSLKLRATSKNMHQTNRDQCESI